jgi:hypothetical protein
MRHALAPVLLRLSAGDDLEAPPLILQLRINRGSRPSSYSKGVGLVTPMKSRSQQMMHPPSATDLNKSEETVEAQTASRESHRASKRQSSMSASGNSLAASRQSGTPTFGCSEALLSPDDILNQLKLTSADPTRWMRRIFRKYGVPYVLVCGKVRATQMQYHLLLDRITCSPSTNSRGNEIDKDLARSPRARGGSPSKSSVEERVTQMLGRTGPRQTKPTSAGN